MTRRERAGPGPGVWEWEGFKKCWLVTLRRSRRRAECWKYLRLGTEPGPIPALGTQSLPGPPLAGKSQVDIAEFSDSLGMETTGEETLGTLRENTDPCDMIYSGFPILKSKSMEFSWEFFIIFF